MLIFLGFFTFQVTGCNSKKPNQKKSTEEIVAQLAKEFLNLQGIRTYYHADKLYEQPVVKDVISLLNIWGKTEKSEHAFLRTLRNKLNAEMVASLTDEFTHDKSSLRLIWFPLNNKF